MSYQRFLLIFGLCAAIVVLMVALIQSDSNPAGATGPGNTITSPETQAGGVWTSLALDGAATRW